MANVSNIKSSAEENKKTNEVAVTDERGRKLLIAKPPYIAGLRLIKALGAELAENTAYMRRINFITWLKSIDEFPVIQPNSELELEALINRLDEEGMSALIQGACKILGVSLEDDSKKEDNEEEVNFIKKS